MSFAFPKEFWLSNQSSSNVIILFKETSSDHQCDKDGLVANSRRKYKVQIFSPDLIIPRTPYPLLLSFIFSKPLTITCCGIGRMMSFTLHFLAKTLRRKLEQKLILAFAFPYIFPLSSDSILVQFKWDLKWIQPPQRFWVQILSSNPTSSITWILCSFQIDCLTFSLHERLVSLLKMMKDLEVTMLVQWIWMQRSIVNPLKNRQLVPSSIYFVKS